MLLNVDPELFKTLWKRSTPLDSMQSTFGVLLCFGNLSPYLCSVEAGGNESNGPHGQETKYKPNNFGTTICQVSLNCLFWMSKYRKYTCTSLVMHSALPFFLASDSG